MPFRTRRASLMRPPAFGRVMIGMHGQLIDVIDNNVQLYHLGNGARSYSPTIQRLLRLDPFSPFSAGGVNGYAFCNGDPINRTDPSGYLSLGSGLDIFAGMLSAVVALALVITTAGMGSPLLMALSYVAAGFSLTSSALQAASGSMEGVHPAVSEKLSIASNIFQIATAVIEIGLFVHLMRKGTNLAHTFHKVSPDHLDPRIGRLPTMVDVAVPQSFFPRAALLNASTSTSGLRSSLGSLASMRSIRSLATSPSVATLRSPASYSMLSSLRSLPQSPSLASSASSLYQTAPGSLRSSLGQISLLL
ncbi:RHS repeat-associated core domain-containing protein [Microvirgula curvata]